MAAPASRLWLFVVVGGFAVVLVVVLTTVGVVVLPQTAHTAGDTAGNASSSSSSSSVSSNSDPAHCGSAGVVCAPGHHAPSPACVNGVCSLQTCDAGYADCDGIYANGCEASVNGADALNCGGCNVQCPFKVPHAVGAPSVLCVAGVCQISACNSGYADCNGAVSDGCESVLASSTQNCGVCGKSCGAVANTQSVGCVNGNCTVLQCQPGYADCDQQYANGCEIYTDVDTGNCGECAHACSGGSSVSAWTCTAGVCHVGICNASYADCDSIVANGCEVALQTDGANCGLCGKSCSVPHASTNCAGGSCALLGCDSGFADCDYSFANGCETSLLSDPAHCGACGTTCQATHAQTTCAARVCAIASCDADWADCDGNYANGCETSTTSNGAHCGQCGHSCGAGICSGGVCTVACASGQKDCNGAYADGCETSVNTDPANCGACGHACGSVPHGQTACVGGSCIITACATGFKDCNQVYADGCELATAFDPQNCGSCGAQCQASVSEGTVACTAGTCVLSSCLNGYLDCDGSLSNGCEINGQADAQHCGTCNKACASAANAAVACVAGQCKITTCATGTADCDNVYSNGCEISTTSDVNNCKSCGQVCPSVYQGTSACVASNCTLGVCNAGAGDCDGISTNGCETNLYTSTLNCGTCGHVCTGVPQGTVACSNGQSCVISGCTAPAADCDQQYANGCETNLLTTTAHCGTCNNSCAAVANAVVACSGGNCVISSCVGTYRDCNGIHSDGCETDTAVNMTNCGSCGFTCNAQANTASVACVASNCTVATCAGSHLDCDKVFSNGCEIDGSSDINHCVTCGNVCSNYPNSSPSCSNGCSIACSFGYENCDNDITTGCEKNVQTDVNNCGTCSFACVTHNDTPACVAAICTIQTCNFGFLDCNQYAEDGCEVNGNTDPNNCRTCGHSCGTSSICMNGVCG